jgi:hypothetical protein
MRIPKPLIAAAAVAFCAGAPAEAGEPPQRIAVFKFELVDTSGGPPRGEGDRLVLITDLLRRELDAAERYEVVEVGPASALDLPAARLAAEGLFSDCNGCEADLAAALGADLSLSGAVYKVSNLILYINVYIRDAASAELVEVHSADIRGNTDESWSRGVSWMIRNRLLK